MALLYVLDTIIGFAALYAVVCVLYLVISYDAMNRAYKKSRERRERK